MDRYNKKVFYGFALTNAYKTLKIPIRPSNNQLKFKGGTNPS